MKQYKVALIIEKIYLGILPEYKHEAEHFNFFIHCGILIASNITNNLLSQNLVFTSNPIQIGFKATTGVTYKLKNVGFKLFYGYSYFGKTELINRFHPYISYLQKNSGFGIEYKL